MSFKLETELYEPVKQFLIDKLECTEVYPEIRDYDVLGLRGDDNIIVEMKRSLSFKVIEQAFYARDDSNITYIAIPKTKTEKYFIRREILEPMGIGLLEVEKNFQGKLIVQETLKPARRDLSKYYPKSARNVRKHIYEFSEDNVGGSQGGKTVTQYSVTIDRIKEYLRSVDDWVMAKDIADNVETHYKDPVRSINATLQMNWNRDWVMVKREYRRTYYKLRENKDT